MISTTEFDVAAYILQKVGDVSAMKLQKLLYYSQAWSMVWDEKELFEADFEAWANGPVLPSIYDLHRGKFIVDRSVFPSGDASKLDEESVETIDSVLKVYGAKTAQWLSNLTHEEAPWRIARGDLKPMDRSTQIIEKGSMHEYYSSL